MNTVDSTATMPSVNTSVSARTKKQLSTEVTGHPADTHDGENLLINIAIGPDKATFDCLAVEHVGEQKNRHVRFLANADCELHFTEFAVFGMPLKKGIPTDLEVLDETKNVWTEFKIFVNRETIARMEQIVPKSPPKIVVP